MVLSNSSDGDVEQRRRHRRDAGVVDEHVDTTELGDGRVDERRALVPVADVAAHGQGPPAARADVGRDRLARVELAARDHDVGARVRETESHGAAETLATAGDDDDLAGCVEAGSAHRPPRRRGAGECFVLTPKSRAIPSTR